MILESEHGEPRALHPLVFLAIYCVPVIFVWLLLMKGYSASLRQAGFTYAVIMGFVPLAASVLNSILRLH